MAGINAKRRKTPRSLTCPAAAHRLRDDPREDSAQQPIYCRAFSKRVFSFCADEMYRCEFCKVVVPSNTPSYKVVVETRPTIYPRRFEANRFVKNRKTEIRNDPGGTGVEIARELLACASCAKKET